MKILNPMKIALEEAKQAGLMGEVPVGAVIIDKNKNLIAKARNLVESLNDATAHAEILAIKEASLFLNNWRLIDCEIYISLEPCAMCASAIEKARLKRVYFGSEDRKGGAIYNGPKIFDQRTCHHKPEVYDGILANESRKLLQSFFQDIRKKKK